jgi:hypothetical protein
LVTPTLGAALATSINGLTLTSSTGTITITNAKTFAVTNSLTLSGTDSTTMTFPSVSVSVAGNSSATAHNIGVYEGAGTQQTLEAPGTAGNCFMSNGATSDPSFQSCPTASVLWSAIGNPTGNLSLTMGANTSAFNTTTGLASFFQWNNTTAATSGASQSSPSLQVAGTEWHSGASVTGGFLMQFIPGTGTDAANTINFAHLGAATGVTTLQAPGPIASGSDGVHAAYLSLLGNTTAPTILANTAGWLGPPSASFTGYACSLPATAPSGGQVLSCATPSGGVSVGTWVTPSSGAVSSVNTLTGAVVIEAATAGQVAISGGSGAALTGAVDLTYSTHTFSGTANTIFDLSAATGTAAFKVPQTTTNTASAAGVIDFDTTNKNFHGYVNGADSIFANFAAAPTTNVIPKSVIASGNTLLTNSLLTDTGTTATYTGTGGLAAPVFTSTGTTAGFADYPQGSTSSAVAPCNTATSICEQAPTAVTSYLVTKPGAAFSGIAVGINASSVITQKFTGDTAHYSSGAVTIGSGTSIGSTSLCSTTDCPAGNYQVNVYADVTTACTTTGTYVINLIYTDDTTVSKTVAIPIDGTGVTFATSTLALSSTTNFGTGQFFLHSTGAASINYSTTAGACGTGGPAVGKFYLTVVPLS